MNIAIVVAASDNWGIGKNNQLPWHLPADLKHFKNITMGGTMIMGRKTFEAIGKVLPGRRSIVITSQKDFDAKGAETVRSLDEALQNCRGQAEVYIIGGGEIFKQALPLCNIIYLTKVHTIIDADVFFPELNMDEWLVAESELHAAGEKNKQDYTFYKLVRKEQQPSYTVTHI